jgi:ATPase subunit of ABC transporter with duplicated ATPase domains
MLRATGLTRGHGGQMVLDGISIGLDARDRVGVVGPNGIGKTTLLRILAGLDAPDAGKVVRRPLTLTVGYLPQEPDPQPGESLLAYLGRRTGVADASATLDACTDALAGDPDALDAYTDALDAFLALGGDDFDARAAETCADVGLTDGDPARLEQSMVTLSGGEAARALLAAILLSRYDVLLLDEPTNNLDFRGLDQLEAFVAGFPGAVLVVSHDRAFLDRAVTRVFEIEEHSHRGREYAGGWTEYLAARALARQQQYDAHAKFTSERDRLVARQRTQIEWSETGVRKAKKSDEPDKNVKRAKIARSEKQASKVKATERKLQQLEVVEKPWEGWRLELALQPTARSGDVVARLEGAVIERRDERDAGPPTAAEPVEGDDGVDGGPAAPSRGPSFRLGPIDLEVAWQDRLGILGPNGSGKTTLIRGLLGSAPLVAGRRWVGPGVVIGELDQGRGRFAGPEPLLTTFLRESTLPLSEARSLLAKFGLGADHVERAGEHLSPGERSRALLAQLMAGGVNCLVLDEPTNHLDLEAIEQLEAALADFDGTLIVVSHDRRFLEAVHLTRTLDLG